MDENGTQQAEQSLQVENVDQDDKSSRQVAAEGEYEPAYECPPSRRPAEDREDSFSVTGWLFKGALGVIDEVQHHDLWMPEEFWVHAYAAKREGTMALGLALDEFRRRAHLGAEENSESEQRQERRGGIEIEF